MNLKYEEIEEKYFQVIKRTYTSDNDEISISPNEHVVCHILIPQTNEFYTETIEYKEKNKEKNNFISKIRALTKQYELLPFSQKYPFLALDIENAAKEGKYYIWYTLTEKMAEDLRVEGFTVEGSIYNDNFKISW